MSYHRIARNLNNREVPTKHGKGTLMRLRISDASHAPGAPRSTCKFVSGKWQAGKVAKVLNSKTVQAWLPLRWPVTTRSWTSPGSGASRSMLQLPGRRPGGEDPP